VVCLQSELSRIGKNFLMVGKCANDIRAVPIHYIRSSVTRRLSPSGRWGEMRPSLSRFTPSPPTSIQFVPLRVSSDGRHT
jgi:hypothetical protein